MAGTLNVSVCGLAFSMVGVPEPKMVIENDAGELWQKLLPTTTVNGYVPAVVGVPVIVLFWMLKPGGSVPEVTVKTGGLNGEPHEPG